MKTSNYECRMRGFELFHSQRVPAETWLVIRVDGHGFSKLTQRMGYHKPFDENFVDLMKATAQKLVKDFDAIYGWTESDEISILLPPDWSLHNREVEKLVSLSAGCASGTFSALLKEPVAFDSRVWMGISPQHVVDYFRWRQADAYRCALNGWVFWTLVANGHSRRQATAAMLNQHEEWKHETLFKYGTNFNNLPAWQKRGIGMVWEDYVKQGVNPKTGESVPANRWRLSCNTNLPYGEDYDELLMTIMSPHMDREELVPVTLINALLAEYADDIQNLSLATEQETHAENEEVYPSQTE